MLSKSKESKSKPNSRNKKTRDFIEQQGKIYLQEKKTIPRWILKKTNLFRISEQIFIHLFLKKVYYDKIIRFSGQGSLELNFLNTL